MLASVAPFPGPSSGVSLSATSDIGGPALKLHGGLRPLAPPGVPRAPPIYQPSSLDITLLGVVIIVGGQCLTWNAVFAGGLLPAATSFILLSGGYIVLLFSLAEIASVYPFAGGAYALVRKCLGYYAGFLIGGLDAIQFLLYISVSVYSLADMIVLNLPSLDGLQPLLWFLILFSASFLLSRSHVVCWRITAVLSAATLLLQLLFCFGSLPFCNITKYSVSSMDIKTKAVRSSPRSGDALRVAPLIAWLFLGADALSLGVDHSSPTRTSVLPLVLRRCILLSFATAIITFFVAASLPSGTAAMADAPLPFTLGYVTFSPLSPSHAAWLSAPATFASIFGWLFAYSRLVAALAASGLVPQWLVRRIQQQLRQNKSTVARAATSSAVVPCFLLCLLLFYGDGSHARVVPRVCVGLAFISYACQTLSYLQLRSAASNNRKGDPLLRSEFRSPFGALGAAVSLLLWCLLLIAVLFLQSNEYRELIVILALVLGLSLYYYYYARQAQVISTDERGVSHAAAVAASFASGSSIAIPSPPRPPSAAGASPLVSKSTEIPSFSPSAPPATKGANNRVLLRAGSAPSEVPHLRGLTEEIAELGDDMEEPYAPNWPPPTQQRTPVMLGSLRRAGSDSVLASSTSTDQNLGSGGGGHVSTSAGGSSGGGGGAIGWGRSFLRRPNHFEKIREETERDLRSALSGIWSERSVRWSRGRADR